MPRASAQPVAVNDDIYKPLLDKGYEILQFSVPVKDYKVTALIASPPKDQLAKDPALLLTVGGPTSHFVPPNDQPANYFWKHGHRVVSFTVGSMPGDLAKLKDNVVQGPDPTLDFIGEAKAILNYCVEQKWVKPDRIIVTGISRYAYLALRLMAADERLKIGGGFAPVTDWRDLAEFADARERTEVINMQLSRFVEQLAGKKIYLSIGSHDERVNTRSCCRFFLDLTAENQKRGLGTSLVDLYVTPDPGHTCGDKWFERGMEILLKAVPGEEK